MYNEATAQPLLRETLKSGRFEKGHNINWIDMAVNMIVTLHSKMLLISEHI